MAFVKAIKSKSLLRLALFGPSGGGKTFSALRIASGIGGKIAVIDSERGSASKYADRFEFDVCDLDTKSIDSYIKNIKEAGQAGYNVLILDSMTHAWQELLEEIDKIAKTQFKGNTWSAWSKGTPKQRLFIDTLLSYPGHIIATMRSKTEWTQEKDERTGKSKPIRVGLAPEQGKGVEYEFDILMELTTEHLASIIKDRTGMFQDKIIDHPSEEFGKELVAWLNSGADPVVLKIDGKQHRQIEAEISKHDITQEYVKEAMKVDHMTDILASDFEKVIKAIKGKPLKQEQAV